MLLFISILLVLPIALSQGLFPHRLTNKDGGSYRAESVNKDLATEVARLKQQAIMWWPKEKPILERMGLSDGLSVADIGCGPGFLSSELLHSYPHVRVTGVELDPKLLRIADEQNRRFRPSRWHSLHASIDHMPSISSNSFDIVILRYLVQHLPNPGAALKEVIRVLKPNGKLIIIDIDQAMAGIFSPGPQFQAEMQAPGSLLPEAMEINRKLGLLFDRTQDAEGGNRNIGRTLFSLLEASGLQQVSLETALITSAEEGLSSFKKLLQPDARAWKFFRKGIVSQSEVDLNEDMLDRFFADPASIVMDLEFVAVGSKPAH